MLKKQRSTGTAPAPRRSKTKVIEALLALSVVAAGTTWFLLKDPSIPGMVKIPSGCFTMGAAAHESDALHSEKPAHPVCLSAFQIDPTEVTQQDFLKHMGHNPSHNNTCSTCPVESVTWTEAQQYCQALGKRLPTEAEWEYAARAGTQTPYFWGDEFNPDYSWNAFNSHGTPQPVRTNLPNDWRLYDMSGNVWEWVADWADNTYYTHSPKKDPKGPTEGTSRMVRGGSFNASPRFLRSATRGWAEPHERLPYVGFRCAR